MVKTTTVSFQCDLCKRTDAGTWVLETPERERARVDLCPKHAEPLARAFDAGRKPGQHAQGSELLDSTMVADYDG